MADTARRRVWPLYVVPDVATGDRLPFGSITYDGGWQLEHNGLSLMEGLPQGSELRTLAELWLEELANEIQAANGTMYGAEPLSVSRMEWRRVFHNNHFRIGPAETLPVSHAG